MFSFRLGTHLMMCNDVVTSNVLLKLHWPTEISGVVCTASSRTMLLPFHRQDVGLLASLLLGALKAVS